MQKSSSRGEANRMRNRILIACCAFLFFASGTIASAATLSIGVSSQQVKKGDTVTATVYVNSSGVAINNVDGKLSVPSDMLEIQSVSTAGSAMALWVEQPSYGSGQVSFNGGITNPGFTGSNGKVLSVVLKAIKAGTPTISFSSATVRANDGLGTNVLTTKGTASLTISDAVVPVPVTPPAPSPAPVAPVVTPTQQKTPGALELQSSTTPDAEAWYNVDSTSYSWSLPRRTTAVRTLFDSKPTSVPAVSYVPPISSKGIPNLEDGIWYFHVSYQTSAGWSTPTHQKLQIDTEQPTVPGLSYSMTSMEQVELTVKTSDELSGIGKIIVTAEGETPIEVTEQLSATTTKIVLPATYAGTKEVEVRSVDKAGNISVATITVTFPQAEIVVSDVPVVDSSPSVLSGLLSLFGNVVQNLGESLSNLDPVTLAVCLVLFLAWFAIYKLVILYRFTHKFKGVMGVQRDMFGMMRIVKRNLKQDIHLVKMDRTITDPKEAEEVVLKNVLQDVTDMEKVVKAKIDVLKPSKK